MRMSSGASETALRPVEMHRRDAEVEQDRVGADAVRRQLWKDDAEIAAQQTRVHAEPLLEPLEVLARRRIAVDRGQLSAAGEIRCEERGVAAGTEGRVDDRLARAHSKACAHLLGENGDVISFSV